MPIIAWLRNAKLIEIIVSVFTNPVARQQLAQKLRMSVASLPTTKSGIIKFVKDLAPKMSSIGVKRILLETAVFALGYEIVSEAIGSFFDEDPEAASIMVELQGVGSTNAPVLTGPMVLDVQPIQSNNSVVEMADRMADVNFLVGYFGSVPRVHRALRALANVTPLDLERYETFYGSKRRF